MTLLGYILVDSRHHEYFSIFFLFWLPITNFYSAEIKLNGLSELPAHSNRGYNIHYHMLLQVYAYHMDKV